MVYELHIGTFTPEGTLDSAIERLDHLRSIGVDLVEVMPVNAFNGRHNWGYDGVDWFAVSESYGGPPAYQRFVDACHAAGLGVVQDVVYNHLGPSGNYLPLFGPYLKQGRNTWGDLVNLDGEGSAEVRRFILDNLHMWFADYHVDALRLDAVHALSDASPVHIQEEMAVETAALSAHLGRPLTLIAESDLNDTKLVTPREAGGYGLDAQWSDDFHHALHVALTGETSGYYADFAPLSALAKVCERGFFHDGTWSSFRGRDHGVPVDTARMPTWRLVVCSQNHDQIGNRARGDRLTEHLDDDQLACAALLTLCGPYSPMLFMGEEWAASTPFQFFTSHPEPELGRITAEGRIRSSSGWAGTRPRCPTPRTRRPSSGRSWTGRSSPGAGTRCSSTSTAASRQLRRTVPALTDPSFVGLVATADEDTRLFQLTPGRPAARDQLRDVPAGCRCPTLPETGEILFTTPTPAVVRRRRAAAATARRRAAAGRRRGVSLVTGDASRVGDVERLETTDLVIRPPAVEDAAEAFELLNDPDVRRWNPARDCPDVSTRRGVVSRRGGLVRRHPRHLARRSTGPRPGWSATSASSRSTATTWSPRSATGCWPRLGVAGWPGRWWTP